MIRKCHKSHTEGDSMTLSAKAQERYQSHYIKKIIKVKQLAKPFPAK